MARQYVGIRFRPGGQAYTYHWDGDHVFVGDRVKVDGRDGWQRVTVETVSLVPPNGPFQTKAILGRVEDVPEPKPEIDPDRLREDRDERRGLDRGFDFDGKLPF